jgi:F420-non-reducing hydrogenase iron-sulfur subunit
MSEFEPKILVFLCNWCSYAGADLAGVSRFQYPTNTRAVRVMCSTRVSPHIVLELLKDGMDAVMISGCHIGDCHYINGNFYTQRRYHLARKLAELAGIGPERLDLQWVSASEGDKYARVITEFVDRVKKLGPSPVKSNPDLAIRLAAAVEAAKLFRLKVLTGKEVKILDKGNVYGEIPDEAEYNEILDQAIEEEFQRCLVMQLTTNNARSVKELAQMMGTSTDKTLEWVVNLRSKNLLAMDHVEDRSPKYKAIIVGGA